MGRPRQPPQPGPTLVSLQAEGITRDRAILAVRLAKLRLERDWNWTELANAAGVSWKQVEEVETGHRDPQFSTVVKLAKALEVHSLDEMLGELPLASVG